MRNPSAIRRLSSAAATLAILAGCSGGAGNSFAGIPQQSVSQSQATLPTSSQAKSGNVTEFISDWDNDVVYIIRGGKLSSTLHVDGPEGLAVDASHNLYVVQVAYSQVLIYAPPYNGSPKILSNAGVRPVGVAVDRNGNVAVTSVPFSGSAGGVVFYAKGATNPTNAIPANGKFSGDFYCAFDKHGNLYLDSENGSGPFEAGEVAGGISGTKVTPLTTNNLVTFPAGMQVTESGKIAILDESDGSGSATIYAYNPPKHGSFGNPVSTTRLSASNDALAFAFVGRRNQFVLTADTLFDQLKPKRGNPNHQDQIGQTQEFAYPSGGGVMESVRLEYNATLVGVAVDPAASP
jgi:hypothetical protein